MVLLFGVLFLADQTTSSGLAELQEFGVASADRMLKSKKSKKSKKKAKKAKKKAKKMKKQLKKMKKDMKKMKNKRRGGFGWSGASNLVATAALSAIATSALIF